MEDDGSLWRLTRALKRGAAPKESGPLRGPNGVARSFEEKAKVFADHLQNIFAGNAGHARFATPRDWPGGGECSVCTW